MSPRTPEQFEEIRDSRRIQILEAALTLFATEGYGHSSISKLAAQAGISKGLMYHYFESKEALLGSLIEHGMTEFIDLFDPDHHGILESEELVDFVRKVFATMREHQKFWILFVNVIMQPKVRELLKDKPIVQYIEQFLSMLLVYFEKKGFEDPYLEVVTFSALIEGFGVLMIYANPAVVFPEELINKFEKRIIDMYK
jgi:AcrR family transcriptional regulator